MATLPHHDVFGTIRRAKRATHAAHRKAFGAGRKRTPEQLAADIASSILLKLDEGRTWHLAEYGLDTNIALRGLVFAALAALDSEGEALTPEQVGLEETELF
jgi:hypothetical protein